MNFFIQVDKDNVIRDCIENPHDGYIQVELDTPLPIRFISGCYIYLGANNYKLDEVREKEILQAT